MFDRFHWWHAVLIFVVANAVSAVPAGLLGDDAFYHRLRKPPGSPPDWAFPPVWLVLNVTSLVALWLVADRAAAGPARTAFFWSEAAGWVTFAAFTGLFFGLKSPTLGAADTLLGLLIAAVSVACAWRLRGSCGVWPAVLLVPRLLWLGWAGYVSTAVAWLNRG